jgi:hypothetical protein
MTYQFRSVFSIRILSTPEGQGKAPIEGWYPDNMVLQCPRHVN